MATKSADAAAAKAKKQKIVLVVAGVLFVGLAAMQGPKLMKHGASTPTAAPATGAATPAPVAAVSVTTPAGGSATVIRSSTAVLAGVTIPNGSAAEADSGQLLAFSLFDAKDPFVQQADDQASTPAAGATAAAATTPPPTASGGTGAAGAASTPAPKPPKIAFATIMYNGKPQQLEPKDKFPKGSPLFVLVSVKKNQAKIGVAGGSFDDGKTVTLTQGKKVTLVDTATGVRYELKLVYTGSTPEVIEGFSSAGSGDAASNGAATTTTPAPSATNGTTTAAATP